MQIQERWNLLTQPLARHWPTGRWTEGRAAARGVEVKLDGILQANDQFHVTSNSSGVGDVRNIIDLTGLQLAANNRVASRKSLLGLFQA